MKPNQKPSLLSELPLFRPVLSATDIRTADGVTLRDYQVDAINAVLDEWTRNRTTLLVLPTGAGKTVCFTEIIQMAYQEADRRHRVLILSERRHLTYQAIAQAKRAGLSASIEMAEERDDRDSDVLVSTVQTQISERRCNDCRGVGCELCNEGKRKRMTFLRPESFGWVICDEAHRSVSSSWRQVLEWYKRNPRIRILMVTATPHRTDGIGLHNVCDSVAYQMDLRQGIELGWLVPIRQRVIRVDSLRLDKIKTASDGDLVDAQVERAMLGETEQEEQELLHAVARPTVDQCDGRQAIIFAAGIDHATKLAIALRSYGVTAEAVTSKVVGEERERIIDRFRGGVTQILVNVAVLTEGFDAPACSVIVMARPTKSLLVYLQAIGRGTRPLPGVVDGPATPEARRDAIAASAKPECVVLDFRGNAGRHKIVSLVDALAGDVLPEDADATVAMAAEIGEPVDMLALLQKAQEAREAREQREAQRKAEEEERDRQERIVAAEIAYESHDVDIFGRQKFDAKLLPGKITVGASPKSINYAVKLGMPAKEAMAASQAKISRYIEERKQSAIGGDYRMPFGKFAGQPIRSVPYWYWEWLSREGKMSGVLREHYEMMQANRMATP